MPRNGSGSASLAEPPFVPNTPISSADMNANLDDIAEMLTDSLSRSGEGGMLAVLELDNDGFTYTTDPNTGMRRTAGDEQAIECGGVDVIEVTPTGATVNGDLEVTGDITNGGNPLVMVGEGKIWFGTVAPTNWLICNGATVLRATYPDLWTFAAAEIALSNSLFTNGNGTTTFTLPDLRGRVPAGDDGGAGRLTSATMTPDGDTLGAVGGTQNGTILQANLPNLNFAVTDPGHTHIERIGSAAGGQLLVQGSNSLSGDVATGTETSAVAQADVTGTVASGGSGTAVANVQPSRAFKFIIYAGA